MNRHAPSPPDGREERQHNRSNLIFYKVFPSTWPAPWYHLDMRQLPACCFPKDVERTYDRSFERFAELVAAAKV